MSRTLVLHSSWDHLHPWDLLSRVESLGRHKTVVDWGCGLNHSPISQQVRELECDLLVSVDAWPEYISTVAGLRFKAGRHFLRLMRVEQFLDDLMGGRALIGVDHVDLSLCIDIVEHLEKEQSEEFLTRLKKVSRSILIWVPLGHAPVDRDTYGGINHDLHTHRSTWEEGDLVRLGYSVQVLVDAHTPMFGHRVDAGWAHYVGDWRDWRGIEEG